MKKTVIIILTALAAALTVQSLRVRYLQDERDRYRNNQDALLGEVSYYRTSDSLSAAGVDALTLTNRELEAYCGQLEKTVESLGLKVNRLQAAANTATETEYPVRVEIRDSILPGRTDTVACIDYMDNYLTLSGCFNADRFSGTVISRDTLVQVVHRVPRRFLGIPFGTKAIRQEVVCKNPYSRVVYTEYLELKRRWKR